MTRGFSLALPVLPWVILAGACSGYEAALGEFDAVSRMAEIDRSRELGETTPITQADPSLYRSLEGIDENNPSGFARERLETLVDSAAGDLERSSQVIFRLLWVAEMDRSPLNRIRALQGMAQLMDHLGLRIAVPDIGLPALAEDGERRLAELAARRGDEILREPERQQLLEALDWVSENPLPGTYQRRRLIGALSELYREAPDEQLRSAVANALNTVLEHAVFRIFSITLLRDAPSGVEVRRAAFQELHRRGGPDAVAFLIYLARRPPDPLQPGIPGYDPSPFVLLDLVRMCGQLNRERALRGYGGGPPPAEFLYELISSPVTPRALRVLALESLALSLGKPVSFDQDWADEWYREWNEERIRRGPGR